MQFRETCYIAPVKCWSPTKEFIQKKTLSHKKPMNYLLKICCVRHLTKCSCCLADLRTAWDYIFDISTSQNKMKWIYTQMLEILNEDTTTYSLLQADRIRLFHFFVPVSTWCPPPTNHTDFPKTLMIFSWQDCLSRTLLPPPHPVSLMCCLLKALLFLRENSLDS